MLQSNDVAHCFEHYLRVLAPWYDLNDLDNSFRGLVGKLALHSSLLLSAIVAFAAIHQSKTGQAGIRLLAERYHARCLHLLIGLGAYDVVITDGTALAATCLLRSYEILAGKYANDAHCFEGSYG